MRLKNPSPSLISSANLFCNFIAGTKRLHVTLIILGFVVLASQNGLCQIDWVKHDGNPVFMTGPGESWDNKTIISPWIIKEEELYVMWYNANNGKTMTVGRATSPDGINWIRDPPNPVMMPGPHPYDSKHIFASCVLRDDQGYRMWYTGTNLDNVWTICLATSADGLIWAKSPSHPVMQPGPDWCDGTGVGDPCVIFDEGAYKMWYTCYNRSVSYTIGYATSPDGINWEKHPNNPVLRPAQEGPDSGTVRSPCVIKNGDLYEMWYRGISTDWTVCYATSSDGISWTRYHGNPVLHGEAGGWDEKIWFPRVILEENRYSMWYVSSNTDVVGYAYSPIPERLLLVGALCSLTSIWFRQILHEYGT